ncbi:hypothetical protein DVA78_19305, partial [Acinetobacter baumannii]
GSVSAGRFDPELGAAVGFAEAVFLLGITALFAGLETIGLTVKSDADGEWLSDLVSDPDPESSSEAEPDWGFDFVTTAEGFSSSSSSS